MSTIPASASSAVGLSRTFRIRGTFSAGGVESCPAIDLDTMYRLPYVRGTGFMWLRHDLGRRQRDERRDALRLRRPDDPVRLRGLERRLRPERVLLRQRQLVRRQPVRHALGTRVRRGLRPPPPSLSAMSIVTPVRV